MADTKKARIVFDDFSGGDYGRDWAGSSESTKFRAVNVIPYPGGWIGPRQPLVQFTIPGLNSRALWFVENDLLLMSDGYAWNLETAERSVDPVDDVTLLRDFIISRGEMFCVSSDVDAQPSTVIATRNGSFSDTVPQFLDRPQPPTAEAMPSGLRIGAHEDSNVLAAWTIFYWSRLNQATNWLAEDFNDVAKVIYDIASQKNTLVLLIGSRDSTTVSESLDTQTRFTFAPGVDVYVVYGVLGASATIRKVDSGPSPTATDTGAFIWTTFGDEIGWTNGRWLMKFDGSEVRTENAPLPRLIHSLADFMYGPTAVVNFWSQTPGPRQGEYFLSGSLGDNGGVDGAAPSASVRRGVFNWFHGDSWTAHDPGIEFQAEPAVGDNETFDGAALSQRGDSNFFVWRRGETTLVFTTQGSTSPAEAPKFYEMDLQPQFPNVSEDDGDTSEPVTADFYTHDFWDPQGREMYVDGIWVDYAYSAQDTEELQAATQTATFEVESVQLYDDRRPRGGGESVFTPPFVPIGESSDSGSLIVRGREYIPVHSAGSGTGFRIHISNWRGMTIRSITADVTFSGMR